MFAKETPETSLSELQERIEALRARQAQIDTELGPNSLDSRYLLSGHAADLLSEREVNAVALDSYTRQAAAMIAERDRQHAAQGERELEAVSALFIHIDRDISDLTQGLQEIQSRRNDIAREAESRLSQWPEHWESIKREFLPREDHLSRIVRAALSYRLALRDVEDPFSLQNDRRLSSIWQSLTVSPDEAINGKFGRVSEEELTTWLAHYRKRDL